MIRVRHKGDFKKTENFLRRLQHKDIYVGLEELAELGVQALRNATPVDSGLTADSWSYEIVRTKERVGIRWINTNVNNGANIAILIQYGHATGTGGYVEGRDYINPAIQPIFDMISDKVWKEVVFN